MVRRVNSPLLPDNIRGLIIGKSNCGKTTLLLNLLLQSNWLDYNHLYVFGNTLHQLEYQILRKGFDLGLSKQQIGNIFKNQGELEKIKASPLEIIEEYSGERKHEIKADFFDDCSMMPDPKELSADEKNLLILDDCFLGSQNKAEAYYTRGRQNNCDTFYISQSYFRLPRHTIRGNMNFLVLFPQDVKNLAHIYADHCEGDMVLDEFKNFCHQVWSTAHNFVVIDLTSEKWNGKYRKNLDTFYFPATNEEAVKMSFLYINNPRKRNEIVADFLAGSEQAKFSKLSAGGDGIQFLPGDINGLQTKLTYLLGEYRAGNTFATRNQIVAISDELLRRGHLSKEKYHNISSIIQLHTK